MDQRIFDQLDALERGARIETRPPRDVYHDSSAEHSAYDVSQTRDDGGSHEHRWQHEDDETYDQPMTLDSFDEQLLRQPDHDSRHGQATLGRARLSLPPAAHSQSHEMNYCSELPQTHFNHSGPNRFDLSRFALDQNQHPSSMSSPYQQRLPSSPSFSASQRRPAPLEYGEHSARAPRREYRRDPVHPPTYEALSVDATRTREREIPLAQPALHHAVQESHDQPTRANSRGKTSATPIVQGISLVSTHTLPDRLRTIFSYPLFNAVQSKSFDTIYKTNNNFVLSAPTGSGKTAILELAICRLIHGFASDTFKIVYQAPTKSLCSERQRDWQAKFGPLGLQCAELTGDTDNAHMRSVQQASIIITTPEKWDSMTRKWKDHQKLMQLVKLFLIDEVHILKEDRGATLEAVVSRMKSVGSDVRFVALSATVPNSEDIATWLGKDAMNPQLPASRERFGEEFRPVRLKKHVCGYQSTSNDFAFEKSLNGKLTEVITKFSQRKPIMVFCFTRNACAATARLLANWWAASGPQERYWSSPRSRIVVAEKDLKDTVSSGVAFHHAGLSTEDRTAVEKGYLRGEINVICCTSTLAVGVNLPCHMAIIKNTVTYQNNAAGGCKEYSDLEIMQMLGRAGRPQFDDSAVAVIMTRSERVQYYEKMISGQEILESCLHRNLIDHLNSEIGLGTVTSASSAKKWLSGTFLYVRLKDNPEHYKIEGDAPGRSLDDRLANICSKGIARLEENDLVSGAPKLRCTEFGDAMARYYLQFETMRDIMALPPKAKVSEILSTVSQAAEFKDVRFRAGEKAVYKDLNKNASIKFPFPGNLDAAAQKVSLVIQSVLGAVDLPTEDYKHRAEFTTAKAIIFQHATRLARCIVDCQLYLEDAVTTRNALMLARSIGAQVWDDSPLHLKQLDGVGLVYVRKLASAGIKSVEDLENTEAHRIEQALSRNPPFGFQLQEKAKAFPKLRVSLRMMGEPVMKKGEHVAVKLKAEIGFLNDKIPEMFLKRPVYVCLLAETSDGHKIHFARISAKKLNKGQDVLFSANLTNANQSIRAYVMCDEIAGTMRHAVLHPEIPPLAFPAQKPAEEGGQKGSSITNAPNTSKRRAATVESRLRTENDDDEFGDANLDDVDLAQAEAAGFVDIDDFENTENRGKPAKKKRKTSANAATNEDWEPQQLANGKWACNHRCADKKSCKHLCCREGLDKRPKPPKAKENKKQADPGSDSKQTQLKLPVAKKPAAQGSNATPAEKATKSERRVVESREARDLNRLHDSVKTTTPDVPTLGRGHTNRTSGQASSKGTQPRLSFLEAARGAEQDDETSDYGNDTWSSTDLASMSHLLPTGPAARMSPPPDTGMFDDIDEDMGDVPFPQPFGESIGSGHFDFTADGEPIDGNMSLNFSDFINDDFTMDEPTVPQMTGHGIGDNATKKEKGLFLGDSSDSPAKDVALDRSGAQQRQHPPISHAKSASYDFSSPDHRQRTKSSRQVPEHHVPPQIAESVTNGAETQDPVEEKAEADELEEWFKAEFGTEYFNFVG